MNTNDQDLRARLKKLDDLDARLARQERISQMILTMVAVLGAASLIVLGFLIARV